MGSTLSRREFVGAAGALVGAAWLPGSSVDAAVPSGPVRLDSNENPYGPSPAALEAMVRSQAAAARYPDPLETPLTEDLARQHHVTPEQVVLGCGSGEILKMADAAFLAPGKTIVAAEPTFEAVLRFAGLERADSVKVPLDREHRHDLQAMAKAIDARTALVYVCNPNNPTGTIVSGRALEAFIAAVPKGVVVLVDEAYHHFVEDPSYQSAAERLADHPDLVVVRTFSKIHGLAGMRLGYAVGSKERIAALRPHAVWSNGNAAVLEAARASLADTANLARLKRMLNDTRRWLVDELKADGRTVIPSEANFVMIDLGTDVGPVIQALHDRGVRPGRRFPAMPQWLRVSIGTRPETAAFLDALRSVAPRKA
ncbi:MAG TPA: histidinol-phosphate transaminase [Candidatus Polarisedimenticolia bacterium]|nr:histidinol-phosphate transaminase [Candidatus Polarisedimenticolia bacterium]